jgi:hypothetical protein
MGMASETDICNLALTRIGHSQITSLSEGTKAADLCTLHYPLARDIMLRDHHWNFAIQRSTLALLVTTPNHEFAYQHALPADCLKVIRTDLDDIAGGIEYGYPYSTGAPYKIEGRYLLSDEDTVRLEYVARVTDTAQFDTLFVDCLAQRLAAELAMPLADNASLAKTMWDMYAAKIRDARSVNAQEGTPREFVDATGWLTARL